MYNSSNETEELRKQYIDLQIIIDNIRKVALLSFDKKASDSIITLCNKGRRQT